MIVEIVNGCTLVLPDFPRETWGHWLRVMSSIDVLPRCSNLPDDTVGYPRSGQRFRRLYKAPFLSKTLLSLFIVPYFQITCLSHPIYTYDRSLARVCLPLMLNTPLPHNHTSIHYLAAQISRSTMANFSDTPTTPSNASPHVSILDIFLPGSTSIITAIERLVSGKVNDLVSIFCLVGILAYGAKHAADYLLARGDDHLSM